MALLATCRSKRSKPEVAYSVFIDGAVGTTGLEIVERLAPRAEFELLILDDEARKDAGARRDAYHAADFAVLCLPDDAAKEAIALAEGSEVIVESFIRGEEHRLLVVGDHVAAANKGETASVVGDGVHTVNELIEIQINSDPRRGEEEDFPLDTIRLDEHTTSVLELKRQGLTADSVPEAGRSVLIMRTGNMA